MTVLATLAGLRTLSDTGWAYLCVPGCASARSGSNRAVSAASSPRRAPGQPRAEVTVAEIDGTHAMLLEIPGAVAEAILGFAAGLSAN